MAIGLLYGELTAEHYEDAIAQNPQIDQLHTLMKVEENKRYTTNYLDPDNAP